MENWILLGAEDEEIDLDGWYDSEGEFCDPEVESECIQYCEEGASETSDCLPIPCICPAKENGKIPKWCDECPNPRIADDTLPRWLRIIA